MIEFNQELNKGEKMKEIKNKNLEDIQPKEYSWGKSWPVVQAEETEGELNAFYKEVRKPEEKATFHKKSTENHLVVRGKGAIVVGERKIKVKELMSIIIPPNTPHQVIPDPNTVMEIYVTATPAVTKEDIFTIE